MRKTVLLLFLALLLLVAPVLSEGVQTLSYGATGDSVQALQERLAELGYYTFRITGNYQENTQKAVRAFQAAHGYAETGTADEQLQWLIFSADAIPVPSMNMSVAFTTKLEYGSKGDDVSRVQTRLAELGYYHDKVSGQFLDNTKKGVKAFQTQNGLISDGIVGQDTWQALFFAEDVVDVNATPKPTPEPTPIPYRIGVDLTNQVVTIYELDDENTYTNVLKHMICSTGTAKDPTAPGTYILNGRTTRWCYFPKWGTHAQYWTRIDSANAFHSVIYSEPNSMALKTGSYTGLGKPASHGCIRLMIDDAKWIYDNVVPGMEVFIHENELDEELTKSLKIPPLDRSVMLPEPTPQPTPSPVYDPNALPPMPFTTLERGVESEAVYWLQCRLAEMGYYKGTITGGYYAGTAEAVKAFQRDNGLSADGKAGKKTLNLIYAEALATPDPNATPEPTLDPAWILQLTASPASTAAPVSPSQTITPTPTDYPTNATWFVPDTTRDRSWAD